MVSVIVPVYNAESYLKECIESIMCQSYTEIEIILIDDGSTDNSSKIINDFAKKDDRIKCFYQENQGVSAARNYGIQMAKGEYLYFVDSDDWIDENTLLDLMQIVLEQQIEFAFSNYYYVYEKDKKILDINSVTKIINKTEMIENYLLFKNRGLIGGCLFSRNKWNNLKLEFPKLKQCEEFFLIIKFVNNVDKVLYFSQPLYYYRQREESAIHNITYDLIKSSYQITQEIIEYMKKDVSASLLQAFSALTVCEMFHIMNDIERDILSQEQWDNFNVMVKERIRITTNRYIVNSFLNKKQKLSFWLCKHNLYFIAKKYFK